MESRYTPVHTKLLMHPLFVLHPRRQPIFKVSLSDPATTVMTDFKHIVPLTIEHNQPMANAHERMVACGVRMLFVTNGDNDLCGLITATDLLGDKPVRRLNEMGGTRHSLLVRDIMTPMDAIEAIDLEEVMHSKVGNIVETTKRLGRQHLLVVENSGPEGTTIRGLFSLTQICRQLGVQIPLGGHGQIFSSRHRVQLAN